MYKKILIKSEKDLPKEDGYYFVSYGDKYDINIDIFHYTKINAKQNHLDWLEHVDWYLIESPISVPTEEEIEKYILTIKRPEKLNTVDYYCTGINVGAKWAIDEIIKRNK